jgi:S-formylglutathione hydrolase
MARLILLVLIALWTQPALAQSRVVQDTIRSQALAGNAVGDAPERDVFVYLPPSYATSPTARFPVLYLLHGHTSHPSEWLDGTYQGFRLQATMDSLVAAGMPGYIVVMPDGDNAYGGSFWISSRTFGGWEQFVAQELVQHVDGRYRTTGTAAARGLAGFSMGGFGALHIAPQHPETFGFVYALSPCCLGFVGEMSPGSALWTTADTQAVSFERGVAAPAVRRAWLLAAASAPADHPAPFTHLPFTDSADTLHATPALDTWRLRLPLETPRSSGLRALHGVMIDYGGRDQIPSVVEGSRAYGVLLRRLGVEHTLHEFDGDHVGQVRARFALSLLPWFGERLR